MSGPSPHPAWLARAGNLRKTVAVHLPPRIFRRVPFETAVRLQFDRFRGFVEEFSANLSLGGMFIRTDDPQEIGTVMPIEFRLGEDYELIRGKGRVVWVREEALDEEYPAGMGIRFLELTPGSRELIFKLVERRVREGGEPFDLDAEAEILDDLPQRPPDPGPAPETVLEDSATAESEDRREAGAGAAGAGEDIAAEEVVAEDVAPEAEEFDPWEEPSPTPSPPALATPAVPATAPGPHTTEPEPVIDQEGREPFSLGDLRQDGSPGEGEDETGFSEETFSGESSVAASTDSSRAVSPFGTPDTGGESDAPPLPEAPAATPSLSYTPAGGGAAYDDQEERTFVRRRGLILGLILVLVFGGLALGYWLLGQPPELAASGSETTAAAAGGTAAPDEGTGAVGDGAPADSIDASDVDGGLGGVRATPPDQEPEQRPRPEPGAGTADEGLQGAAAGDVAARQPDPEPDPGSGPEDVSGDGDQAGAAASGPLRIESVSHQAAGSRTVVVIQASRRVGEGDYSDFRIGGLSPRHVVRLLGVEQPLPAGQVTVGTGQVARVRSGLHREGDSSELHLVLDFNSAAARVTEIIPAGDTLRVVVEEEGE